MKTLRVDFYHEYSVISFSLAPSLSGSSSPFYNRINFHTQSSICMQQCYPFFAPAVSSPHATRNPQAYIHETIYDLPWSKDLDNFRRFSDNFLCLFPCAIKQENLVKHKLFADGNYFLINDYDSISIMILILVMV